MVNSPLIRPYFLGEVALGGTLGSHEDILRSRLQDACNWEDKFSDTLVKQQQFEPELSSLQAGGTAECWSCG